MTSPVSILLPSEVLLSGPDPHALRLGLLAPLSGLLGVAGPAIINCAILAGEEICLATETVMELVLIDAGGMPDAVAREVDLLVGAGLVNGLVGTHTSNIRVAVEARVADRVPYVFTPPHEFSRARAGSVFLGSDPKEHLRQPIAWLARNRRITRWALIGSDYVWPRQVHRAATSVLRELGQPIVLDRLVPMGHVDAAELVAATRRAGADAILVSLVGRDGIEFHRGVTELDAGQSFVRLCTALDENCLIAVGGDSSGELYSAMPTFLQQGDDRHLRLLESYVARFGLTAPLPGAYAEGCYDGVHVLAALCRSGLLAVTSAANAAEQLFAASSGGAASGSELGYDLTRRPMRLARANDTDLEIVGMSSRV
ncbi:ABC transporter substrate-binding protein [Cryobacterium serini]|uniref:Acetamidase regulator n=1 Tax=Cryobacterium serini TaxID=1259201 RepID=A0A4R9BX31_9MICO|nr:ABC transporter substrate-binding protein [Cryobacterium serini]TFD91441.1 acetamidase regulator [Cryobacterium serini]